MSNFSSVISSCFFYFVCVSRQYNGKKKTCKTIIGSMNNVYIETENKMFPEILLSVIKYMILKE